MLRAFVALFQLRCTRETPIRGEALVGARSVRSSRPLLHFSAPRVTAGARRETTRRRRLPLQGRFQEYADDQLQIQPHCRR